MQLKMVRGLGVFVRLVPRLASRCAEVSHDRQYPCGNGPASARDACPGRGGDRLLDDLDAANEGLEPEEDCCDMADYDMTDRPPRLSYCWRPAIPWMASRNRKDDEQGRGTHPGL